MDPDYPKLRAVEAIPVQDNMICLRDPQGLAEKIVLLHPEAFFIVSQFDGGHSILDIQASYTRRFGDIIFSSRIKELVEQLDEALFLDSERFRDVSRRVIEAFRGASVRRATHAGVSYEEDPGVLGKQLDELFDTAGDESGFEIPEGGILRGLIAPHIDIRRGGSCFALGYAELAKSTRASTFVVLGISHLPTGRRFVLTDKDFETPFGVLRADRDFTSALSSRCTVDYYEDEFIHRNEHSVEFQAVFLKYLYGNRSDLRIVPILCSSKDESVPDHPPGEDEEFQDLCNSLKELLSERGDGVCCIAGVDLSHMGQRFGNNITMNPTFLEQLEREDLHMIETILRGDAEGFFRTIREERNRRNVCGVPAIYTLLKLLDTGNGHLMKYEQSVDETTQSVVSFMAASFYT